MTKGELKYEGKAKKVFATDNPDVFLIEYKDDATAFNAQKRGTIAQKGVVNNAVTTRLFEYLMSFDVPTHFIERLNEREQLVKAVEIIPVEVIVRNKTAGSFAKRYGVAEGNVLSPLVVEWCYKSDELGDPPMSDVTAIALGLATADDLDTMLQLAVDINDGLLTFFSERNLDLIDFKIEFGKLPSGEIILADEISPDTCRLWDTESGERMDKDRFRRDLGKVEEAYQEVYKRVVGDLNA